MVIRPFGAAENGLEWTKSGRGDIRVALLQVHKGGDVPQLAANGEAGG